MRKNSAPLFCLPEYTPTEPHARAWVLQFLSKLSAYVRQSLCWASFAHLHMMEDKGHVCIVQSWPTSLVTHSVLGQESLLTDSLSSPVWCGLPRSERSQAGIL